MVRRIQPKSVIQTPKAERRAKARSSKAEPGSKVRVSRYANLTKEFLDNLCIEFRAQKHGRVRKVDARNGDSSSERDGKGKETSSTPARVRYTDVAMQGLAIDVSKTGRITWRLRVKQSKGARQTWLTLGKYPGMSPEKAREMAEVILGGKSPQDHRRERSPLSVKALAEKWMGTYVEVELAPGTQSSYREKLKYYIYPAFENRRLDELTFEAIDLWHSSLTKKSGPTTADGALRVLSSLLSWAKKAPQGYVRTNPVRDVEKNGPKTIHRPLGDGGLAKVGKTIEEMIEGRDGNPHYLLAILLALLTGWRRLSIASMAWDDISVEERVATLFFHKGARRMGAIQLPLEDEALSLLEQIPRVEDCPFIFPGKNLDRHVSPRTLSIYWKRVRDKAGVKTAVVHLDENGRRYFPDVRFHDLRHTVGAMGGNEGSIPNVAGMLGQASIAAAERYSKPVLPDVREMKGKVEARVAKGLGLNSGRLGAALNGGIAGSGPVNATPSAGADLGPSFQSEALEELEYSDERSVTGLPLQISDDGRYPSKDRLQAMVLEKPVTEIARELGVSDKAVEKVCKRLGVVKPGRGYWARRRAGSS